MTTAAMVFGVIPLILATGAGAVSRFKMGLVITSGLAIGTLFTLFVVPAIYLLIAADHSRERETEASPLARQGKQRARIEIRLVYLTPGFRLRRTSFAAPDRKLTGA